MLAPPGYAKICSTPSRSRARTRMSQPFIGPPTSARGFVNVFFFASVFVLIFPLFGGAGRGEQKTHDRFQPCVLVEIVFYAQQEPAASFVTTTTTLATTSCSA